MPEHHTRLGAPVDDQCVVVLDERDLAGEGVPVS